MSLPLTRDGETVTAQIAASTGTGPSLGGYWAVLEDHPVSAVRADENAGQVLNHDPVVRRTNPWRPGLHHKAAGRSSARAAASPGHPRRVVFVVTDGATQRPLQALALAC